MGNSSSAQPDPELRSLVHKINSYLNSKSTILYQISLLKLKLNSRSSYGDGSEEGPGIENEIKALPELINTLKKIAEEKVNPQSPEIDISADLSDIFEKKDNEIQDLEDLFGCEEVKLSEMITAKKDLEYRLEEMIARNEKMQSMNINEIKEKCSEIIVENENLNVLISELKEKIEFLQKKKGEIMIRRGNKRKAFLGMTIVNQIATELKAKHSMKQDLIKTIQKTKAEQDLQMANFESRNKLINMKNENIEEEEQALAYEIAQNKDRILELEWEIQKLNKDRVNIRKYKNNSGEHSMNFGSADRMPSDESEQGSFGSSLASLLNGFGDYKLEKEAMAEENLKLKQHVQDIISVRRKASPEPNI
jgi:DNA repair exonuclease SbcCD ATPase subunit